LADYENSSKPSKDARFRAFKAAARVRIPLGTPDHLLRNSGGTKQGQLRTLHLFTHGNQLSVVDSHLVDAPLGQVTGLPRGNAYEVTLNGRLLHAWALPRFGVQRSFPLPDGTGVQRGHFVTERDVEFMVRVPA
jgi:hypothetical protein